MEKQIYALLLLAASCPFAPAMAQQNARFHAADDAVATFESIDLGSEGYANGSDGK